jgi:hypothetical protein
MVLRYSTPEDKPFNNSVPTPSYSNMWPTCLSGSRVTGTFDSVSNDARDIGIRVGSQYFLEFSPTGHQYALTIPTGQGNQHIYGTYTWSMAQSFRDSVSGGQNTRQSELDLGVVWNGHVRGMCIATDQNTGTFSSQLGIASFNVF